MTTERYSLLMILAIVPAITILGICALPLKIRNYLESNQSIVIGLIFALLCGSAIWIVYG